jgi:hypothetical protein
MTQREIFQFVELTADNLPEANELFSSGCGRGNEYQQYRGNPRHPFESTRLHRLQGQLDTQIGPALTKPFRLPARLASLTAAVLHRPACMRELGNLSAHVSSNGLQHVTKRCFDLGYGRAYR